MVEYLDKLIVSLGPLGLLILGLAALLEYLVPPFPGDTITLLGGVYAARGQQPWPLVLVVVTAGSVAGAALTYEFGKWLARRFDAHPEWHFFGLTHARLEAVQQRMRRGGPWLLLINRFLPGIRGLIFVAAGAARMPRGNALLLGTVSALVYNGLVLGIGVAVGGNLERLEELMVRYQRAVLGLFIIGVVAVVVRTLARRRTAAT
jgi:membrane protein DedA with SNARE-associated domain